MKIQSTVYKFLAVYCFLPLLTLLNPVVAQEMEVLRTADSLFREQRYVQAYKVYDEILETGMASPGMLLRMAYIQESLGNVSRTLYLLNLYYLQTNDREVLQKIERLAKEEKLEGYNYSDAEYFRAVIHQYRDYIIIGLLVLSGALFLLILYLKVRLNRKPVWQGTLLILLLGGLYIFTNFSVRENRAIVARDQVYLMSGPSAGSGVVDIIRKGHRLKVLGRTDVWYKVEWKNQVLYVKENAVKQV